MPRGQEPTPERRLNPASEHPSDFANLTPAGVPILAPSRFANPSPITSHVEITCTARPAWYTSPHMTSKKTTLDELGEMLGHVVKHMATKDDLAAVESRLDLRIGKLDAKIDRLDTKLTKFEEHEIDKRLQLEVRVTTIEKHLGLDKKIAA